MRRFLLALFTVGAVANCLCAGIATPILREAVSAARTNVAAALKLCDQAVADFPSNAEPLVVRAGLLDRGRRHAEALQDLSAAVKLEPKSAQLWHARGEVNFRAGHFQDSVADFDRSLQLAPEKAPYDWQRGISLYYAKRFADGRKQFELHQTVNPNDVENAAWHFLCLARERGVTNARAAILPVGPDGRIPMQEIYALYQGTGSVEQVLSAAARPTSPGAQREALFYAHLYLGLYFDVLGDPAKTIQHIGQAAGPFSTEHYMGDVARVHRAFVR